MQIADCPVGSPVLNLDSVPEGASKPVKKRRAASSKASTVGNTVDDDDDEVTAAPKAAMELILAACMLAGLIWWTTDGRMLEDISHKPTYSLSSAHAFSFLPHPILAYTCCNLLGVSMILAFIILTVQICSHFTHTSYHCWNHCGRSCKLCNQKDSDTDPVLPNLPGRRWGYPLRLEGAKNSGLVCWYCTKIFEARYKIQHKLQLKQMAAWLGEKADRMAQFTICLEKGIEYMKQLGSHEGRTPWAAFDADFSRQSLVVRNRAQVELCDAEDNWMYFKEYCEKHGEPGTNGLGHTRRTVNGRDVVIIPGSGIGKLRRSQILQADIEGEVANSGTALTGPDQLQEMQHSFMSGMFQAPSTGVHDGNRIEITTLKVSHI